MLLIVSKIQWNLRNSYIFIQENAFKIVVWEMAAIFFLGLNAEQSWWPMYASAKWVIIGSGNDLSPIRRQAITWTNADLCQLDSWEQTSLKFEWQCNDFHSRKWTRKRRLQNVVHFIQASTLIRKCHFDEFYIIGCTGSQNYNFHCSLCQNLIKMTFPFQWMFSVNTATSRHGDRI